jgi:hypothetical protein
VTPLTAERLRERGAALGAWEASGGRTGRLVWLDGRVRAAQRTDWPGRPPGPEGRTTAPAGQEGASRWR